MLYLLIFPLAYGLADAFWMMLGTKVPFFKSLVYRGIVSVIITFSLAIVLESTESFTAFTLWSAIGTGFLSVAAFLFFYKSLQQEASGTNAVVTKGLSSVTTVAIVMCIARAIDYRIILALSALIVGLLFLFYEKEKTNKKVSVYAIIAGIIWGIAFVLYKKNIVEVGSFWFAFILELSLLITVSIIYVFKKTEHSYRFTNRQFLVIACIGLATAIGSILNTYAYNYFSPSVIAIVAKFAVLPPFLFAIIILKQRLTFQKLLGLSAILLAIYFCL